jgi:hypothetical protein
MGMILPTGYQANLPIEKIAAMRAMCAEHGVAFYGHQPAMPGRGSSHGPWWLINVPDCDNTTITVEVCAGAVAQGAALRQALLVCRALWGR